MVADLRKNYGSAACGDESCEEHEGYEVHDGYEEHEQYEQKQMTATKR